MTLVRLSNHINAAHRLTQGARGVEFDAVRADTIAAFLRAAQQLARAGEKRGTLAPLALDADSWAGRGGAANASTPVTSMFRIGT